MPPLAPPSSVPDIWDGFSIADFHIFVFLEDAGQSCHLLCLQTHLQNVSSLPAERAAQNCFCSNGDNWALREQAGLSGKLLDFIFFPVKRWILSNLQRGAEGNGDKHSVQPELVLVLSMIVM